MSVIEFRSYQLHAGCLPQFCQLIQQQSLPLLLQHGEDVLLAQASAFSNEHFLLVRCYQDLAHRQHSQAQFYSSAAWQQGPRQAILACIKNSHDCLLNLDQQALSALRLALSAPLSTHQPNSEEINHD